MPDPVEVIARAIAGEQALGDRWWVYEEEARAVLSALEGEGLAVVPVEATEEMLATATVDEPSAVLGLATRYAVMVAARPR